MITTRLPFITTIFFALSLAGCVTPMAAGDSENKVIPSAHKMAGAQSEKPRIYRLRMFFGLSRPDGGAVSLAEWDSFQQNIIARAFDGFNVVDSTGFYQGKAERSKVVTLIVDEDQIPKARAVAKQYARKFNQDSVMLVKVPVSEWSFIGPD